MTFYLTANCQNVKLVQDETSGKLMYLLMRNFLPRTSIRQIWRNHFLFPVFAPNGSVITRGYPMEPRKGETC